jgi:hypothetical protein
LKLLDLGPHNQLAIRFLAVEAEIFLVIIFGHIKDPGLGQFGHHGTTKGVVSLEALHEFGRCLSLFITPVKDY